MSEVKKGTKYPDIREVFYENLVKNNKFTPYGSMLRDINGCALSTLNDFEEEYGEHCHIKKYTGLSLSDLLRIDRKWAEEWINVRTVAVHTATKELILTDCHTDKGDSVIYQNDLKKALCDNDLLIGKCHNIGKTELINIPIEQIQFAYVPSSNIPLEDYVRKKVLEYVTFDDTVCKDDV